MSPSEAAPDMLTVARQLLPPWFARDRKADRPKGTPSCRPNLPMSGGLLEQCKRAERSATMRRARRPPRCYLGRSADEGLA
eukprot:13842160-Alexandrium_andersonii.AAC.1